MSRAERRAAAKAPARSSPHKRRMYQMAADPITYAICGNSPLPDSKRVPFLADVHAWFDALRAGRATHDDVLGLYTAAHMVEALTSLGPRGKLVYSLGDPMVVTRVIMAVDLLMAAAKTSGRFVCRAADLRDFTALLEVHTELYSVALQSDMEKASRLMVGRMRSRGLPASIAELAK